MITPLNIKTEYTLLSSMIKVRDLVDYAKKNNLKSLNITDNNMFGAMEFYNACIKNNIKPIIGLEVSLNDHVFILYAKNFKGYKNLLKITSNEKSFDYLEEHSNDLICIIPFESRELYEKMAKIYEDIFISFKNEEERYLIKESNKLYMNKVLYLNEEDQNYIKYLYGIKDGLKEPFELDLNGLYLDPNNNLMNENNKYVEDSCNLVLEYEKNLLPIYKCPDGVDSYTYLKKLCIEGLKRIFGSKVGSLYQERLKYELDIINKMGFCNYFLIVYDYVKFAKENGILVGAGRGSAAGSLVSYLLNITEIDPLKYNLLFERFLNPERISMPDIDIDFEYNRRSEVIDYCIAKYGEKKVAPIITFGTLGAKQIIRDLGRVMNIEVEYLAGFIDSRKSLIENYNENEKLKRFLKINEDLRNLYKIAMKLEGIKRHTSIHAAGIVMSEVDLDEVIPLEKNHEDFYITGYSMEYLESLGLLKMDFLALKNLTLINDTLKDLERDNIKIDLRNIPLNDKKTIEIFRTAKTTGIFQFESEGMMNFLRKYKPDTFEDIVAAIALYRPGPMKNIDSYIRRKNGLEKIDYIDESLVEILKPTYGVIVYQEQIMQIASAMAGYSLAEADLLRKAMSKKKEEILIAEKEKFINNSVKLGHDRAKVEKVYNLILKFAEYGFNRAHSVAYSKIAFEMAYLKSHYYKYFMKSLLTSAIGTEKVKEYIYECKEAGLEILKPSVLTSGNDYKIEDLGLRFPLSAIKNIGVTAVSTIIKEREKSNYTDIFDFVSRVYGKSVNKKTLEALALSGSLVVFGYNARTIVESLDELINYAEIASYNDELPKPILEIKQDYSKKELMEAEYQAFGFYLSNHIITEYRAKYNNHIKLSEIEHFFNRSVDLILYVDRVKEITAKSNNKMVFVSGVDETSKVDVVIFPTVYEDLNDLEKGDILVINGRVEKRFDKYQVVVNKIIEQIKE